jgi:quinol-cytochrome oxidoreductase complex cytochrome b subunit
MSFSDFYNWVLTILRDNALEGIGTIFAILLVIVPWVNRKLFASFSNNSVREMFWWISVPLLSVLNIFAVVWQQFELVIIFTVTTVVLYLLRQREFSVEYSTLERDYQELSKIARSKGSGKEISPYEPIKAKKGRQ